MMCIIFFTFEYSESYKLLRIKIKMIFKFKIALFYVFFLDQYNILFLRLALSLLEDFCKFLCDLDIFKCLRTNNFYEFVNLMYSPYITEKLSLFYNCLT